MTGCDLSVIIPVYNEHASIGSFLDEVHGVLKDASFKAEIVVVNDGSTDSSDTIINDFFKNTPVGFVKHLSPNQGKGAAVKKGIEIARGDNMIVIDGDGAFAASTIPLFYEKLQNHDVVLGKKTGYPPLRKFISLVFNGIVSLLYSLPTDDALCGLKGFRSYRAQELFSGITVRDWLYDIEILQKVSHNWSVTHVPVKVRQNPDSKFRLLDPFFIIWKLLLMKFN